MTREQAEKLAIAFLETYAYDLGSLILRVHLEGEQSAVERIKRFLGSDGEDGGGNDGGNGNGNDGGTQ